MQGGGRSLPQIQRKENSGQQDLINLASKSHCLLSPSLITAGLNDINLQLHASSEVSNPYSFNITKDIGFSAACMAENTITVTVGSYIGEIVEYFGYISNSLSSKNDMPSIGKCDLPTYNGIEILAVILQVVKPNYNDAVAAIGIWFAKHVDINKNIIINDISCDINNMNHNHNVETYCIYMCSDEDDIPFDILHDQFVDNVGKQITITLE